jgi:phosphonopyruvate decarboxylase
MIDPALFVRTLKQYSVEFYAGVPDSLLKNLCAWLDDHSNANQHVITANEGNAVALVTGYYLATGKPGVVYMQNSGLGNTINPLASLADPEVYSVPILLIIGWRGAPDIKDEPQHIKQGRITQGQLDLLEIPYRILENQSDIEKLIPELLSVMTKKSCPVALLVRKNTFLPYKKNRSYPPLSQLSREEALSHILGLSDDRDLVVSTTGKTSREVYELRQLRKEKQRDFLTVGSMGHTSSIALGVALGRSDKRVICLDGDGSLIMHMGAMPIIGSLKPANFVHILLNNAAHESVGGQATAARNIDFKSMATACGYQIYCLVRNKEELSASWEQISDFPGPAFIELQIRTGSRPDLGRPATTPIQNKNAFMESCHG